MIYLLIALIIYTLTKDIIGAHNSRRIYEEMKAENIRIGRDNEEWKDEVRKLLKNKIK